jgi:transcriptional regulator with XRE-family HTH domain
MSDTLFIALVLALTVAHRGGPRDGRARLRALRSALLGADEVSEEAAVGRDWPAVAEAINRRLRELDLTQLELAQRSQVSVATIRQLQGRSTEARRRHPRTLRALSEALQWSPDHLEAVADGRDPSADPDRDDPVVAELQDVKDALAAITVRLDGIEQRLAADDEPE